ncbi:MAG: lantibiotic dehydratase [Bacteroidota bacterium]
MSYTPEDIIIIRTPLYPFKNSFDIDVKSLLTNVSFNEALFLSSPSLINEIDKYVNQQLNEKESEKLLLSIYRFYLRAAYRCTPFGLFSGVTIGKVADKTAINLCSQNHYQKNIRLDTHFLSAVIQKAIDEPILRNSIIWFSNNTIYSVQDKLRYIEYRVDKNSRTHHLATVDESDYVQMVLTKAASGTTISQLVKSLITDDISQEDATSFIEEMIAGSLLIPEIEPLVTGKEYHEQLLKKLDRVSENNSDFKNLISIIKELSNEKNQAVGNSLGQLKGSLEQSKSIYPALDSGKLFQCDMMKPANDCTISKAITTELCNTIILLNKIVAYTEQGRLKDFKETFSKRYEEQEIPLLHVLDSEAGIGYPVGAHLSADNTPILANLFVNIENEKPSSNHQSSKWSKFLWSKLQDAVWHNSNELEITDAEIQPIFKEQQSNEELLPDSMYTLGNILATSNEELDKGNFLVNHEVTAGPSAINLLGRFCHMSKELTDHARGAIRKEEEARPECIFAEILHIPQARLGNILMRPVLRNYEIPILTRAAVDDDHTIQLSDLMVSIRNGKIFLRSKRLNKEVMPRLTTAHNFSMNPVPHYHFLCDLQFQGIKGGLSWSWGVLNEFTFLPRVRYRKTILSKARWIFNLSDISTKNEIKDAELAELITAHFTKNQIPNNITITQGDNQLPIDIHNANCLKILIQDLKKHKSLILQECLFNEVNLIVKGPEGAFTNEFIIPWHKDVAVKLTQQLNGNLKYINGEIGAKQRTYSPGSEWHYIKIYCGVKTADVILTEVVKPLTEELLAAEIISKFFFIRYYDPDHHLRIRFKGEGNFYAEVTNKLNEALVPYLEANLVSNIQTEIYKQEIERYGFENMDNSESLFFSDSVGTLNVLALLEGDEGDQLRWQFAIKGVNDLLNTFQFTTNAKRELMSWLSTGFVKEFGMDNQEGKKQLGAKYRECRQAIDKALKFSVDEEDELYHVWNVFKLRYESLSLCASEILKLSADNKLSVGLNDLVASYIHMFLNRFLRSKQRMQEMIIYDLLHQHYKSLLAREKQNNKVTETERVS